MRRYERKRPGDLIHLDIKKPGRFKREGHRVTGCRRKKSRGAGWEYVHVCIDDHSRVSYVAVLENEKGTTAAGFLARAVAWRNTQGVPARQVMTDNGSCYISKVFAAARTGLDLKHIRTRSYTPKTNGKAGRFIQTPLREWAYARPYKSLAVHAEPRPKRLALYNLKRPHGRLNHLPPISRIQSMPCEQQVIKSTASPPPHSSVIIVGRSLAVTRSNASLFCFWIDNT